MTRRAHAPEVSPASASLPAPGVAPALAIQPAQGVAPANAIQPAPGVAPALASLPASTGREHVALPVAVSGPPHVVAQVSAWVESRLGWQVTGGDALPPVVHLQAVSSAGVAGASDPDGAAGVPGLVRPAGSAGVPIVVLVGPDDDPVVTAALSMTAAAVVAWPDGHDDLGPCVADLLGRPQVGGAEAGPDPSAALVVGGAAGGVGTTTVALTLAAWHVWRRHDGQALAVTSGPTPVPGAGTIAADVLAGHRGWAAAMPVADVVGLRVARAGGPVTEAVAPAGVPVVHDVGVVAAEDPRVDVLVVRRDAAGFRAVQETSSGTVVVADDGPVTRQRMVAAAEGRRLVTVPWSVRVARAHALGRLPGSLPGTYATTLASLVP